MENWITRFVATLCATGSTALFWILGAFIAALWREEKMHDLSGAELQLISVPLIVGTAVVWAALHLFALADRGKSPTAYTTIRVVLITASIVAAISGGLWAQLRMV